MTTALCCTLLTSSGCGSKDEDKLTTLEQPKFTPFYELLEEMQAETDETTESRRITLSTKAMPMTDFLRYVADTAGISIVCDQAIDALPVNVNVTETAVEDVLSAVARRAGVDITEQGGVFYLGALKPQDRAILVRKVKRLTADEIKDMVETLASEVGRVAAPVEKGFASGIILCADISTGERSAHHDNRDDCKKNISRQHRIA